MPTMGGKNRNKRQQKLTTQPAVGELKDGWGEDEMPTKGGKVDDDRVKTAVLLLLFICVGLNPGQAFQV